MDPDDLLNDPGGAPGPSSPGPARPVPLGAALAHAIDVARALAGGADARDHVCRAARAALAADWVALLEPDGADLVLSAADGELTGPVRVTADPAETRMGATFSTGRRQFVGSLGGASRLQTELALASGTRTALHLPVLSGEDPIGVLSVGWSGVVAEPDHEALQLLELLALDAAIAIEHHRLVARLATEARTDPLTGLSNRRAWQETAPRELRRAARHGLEVTLALLDLDDFKQLNDGFGHVTGDRVLQTVAAQWRAGLREADLLARLGGDEFSLLMVPSASESGPEIVQRLLARLPIGVTCSVGLVTVRGVASLDDLVARADAALYRAKAAGKGRVVLAEAASEDDPRAADPDPV